MELPVYLKNLLPFDSHFAQIAGHRMHYIDEGQGEVVVLLHGNPTWSFFYRGLIAKLKTNYRVIAPDFIGCGLSDHPTDAHFRATDRVRHLELLLEKLQIKKLSLVMHDWGGSIGTSYAVRNLDKIAKIVYLNTTLTETETLPWIIRIATKPVIGKFLTKYSRRFLKLTTGQGVCKKLAKDVKRGYMFPYQNSARRTAIWDFVADIPWDSSHPTYAEMLFLAEKIPELSKFPVKIIWGLKDPCFHREMLTKVAHHFPQAEVIEIPEASHLVLEDAPQIAFPAIEEFLGRQEVSSNAAKPNASEVANINPLFASFGRYVSSASQSDAVIEPTFIGDTPHYKHLSYTAISQLIQKYQRGLAQLGLVAGDRVLMLAQPGADFLALTYAVMGRGATPFFLDPGMGRENLFKCIEQINPDAFIGSPKAQLLRLKRKKLFPKLKFHITTSEWFYTGGPNLSFLKKFASLPLEPVPAPDVALVAFTSGGTGMPKGVEFTREMIRAQLEIFQSVFSLEPGTRDIPLLPIFSIFSLALGVGSIFPPMDPSQPLKLEAWKIVRIANDLQATSSFGSPTLWNKICEYCFRSGENLKSLRRVFMAGAPVTRQVIDRVKGVLPQGEVYTPYGSTEALPVTLISSSQIAEVAVPTAATGEEGTLVGKVIPGISVRIVKTCYEANTLPGLTAVEPLEIGEILVTGTSVSRSYFERPHATSATKIADGSVIWHRMGDLGYVDHVGNIYFCGRVTHAVRTALRTYYSIPSERIFNQHPKVKRSALVSLHAGKDVGIVIEPYPQDWPETEEARQTFINELLALGKNSSVTREIKKVFFHRSFPVDGRHNAKIFRDKLSDWASQTPMLDKAA